MNEADFALEVEQSIRRKFKTIHYNKIPDQIYNPNAFFNPEKKYDAYVTIKSRFTALEYKFHKKMTAFPVSKVSLIQRASLIEVKESGCAAYVVIGIRCGALRKCYFICIDKFMDFVNNGDRKSMTLEFLEQFPEAPWIGKGRWDIDEDLFIKKGEKI